MADVLNLGTHWAVIETAADRATPLKWFARWAIYKELEAARRVEGPEQVLSAVFGTTAVFEAKEDARLQAVSDAARTAAVLAGTRTG